MAKKDKYNIKKTLKEYLKSQENSKMENVKNDTQKSTPEEDEIIDKTTFLVTRNDKLRDSDIRTKINKIIEKYGTGQVYIGITGNSYGRMTGVYPIEEGIQAFRLEEIYDSEPHDKPHIENNYGMMFILFETDSIKDIIYLEKHFVSEFKEMLRNRASGGGGRKSGPPYYLYAVVQKETFEKVNNASSKE